MNASYAAIGALFVVLGVAGIARAKQGTSPQAIKGGKLSGALFLLAGAIFLGLALFGKR
jgi:drug/metabolite transporter (DMT)-like permease